MTDSSISIRLATEADALCLQALGTQVFFETYATSGIRESLVREAQAQFSVSTILLQIANPAIRVLLAERSGHLVGFAEVHLGATHDLVPAGPVAELSRIYVQGPFLRQSIGTQLLKKAETLARAEGATTFWLTVWEGNTRARAFYASHRYADLGATEYVFEGEIYENRLLAKVLSG